MYLIQTAIKRTLEKVKDSPEECGFDEQRNVYQPLKLVRIVVSIVNSIIIDLQDNAKLYEVPLPPTSPNASDLTKLKEPPKYCVDAIKNSRRTMEDKHMIIDDFNGFFNTQVSNGFGDRIFMTQHVSLLPFRTQNQHSTMESSMVIPAPMLIHTPIHISTTTLPSTQSIHPTLKVLCERLFW